MSSGRASRLRTLIYQCIYILYVCIVNLLIARVYKLLLIVIVIILQVTDINAYQLQKIVLLKTAAVLRRHLASHASSS